MRAFGYRVSGSGFRALGCEGQGLGFRAEDSSGF